MLEEALRASSFESEPPRSPPPKHLLEGVRAAVIKEAASIQAGAHCKSRKGKDRWKVVDALVAGENLSFGVVAEGLGEWRDAFRLGGVDGSRLLRLGERDLRSMGVADEAARMEIGAALRRLAG